MKLPSVIVAALLIGALAVLQHLALHVGDFQIPELYAPFAILALNTVIKIVQEYKATLPESTTRGLGVAQTSLAARVLYK